eukprot:7696620-Pyramimonas_sp.AAC.1
MGEDEGGGLLQEGGPGSCPLPSAAALSSAAPPCERPSLRAPSVCIYLRAPAAPPRSSTPGPARASGGTVR